MIATAAAALAAGGLVLWPRRAPMLRHETVPVRRGSLTNVVRETGTLRASDSIKIKIPVQGTLEWIIGDGEWVDPDGKLFVLNVDRAMIDIAEARTDLLGEQQELALERLRRRHAEKIEAQKVEAAERLHRLEVMRYRILSAPPKGGTALIELHEALLPLEEETARTRRRYEEAQDRYQEAQDRFMSAVDALQEKKDAILHLQTRADEYRVRLEADFNAARDRELTERQVLTNSLRSALAEIEKTRTLLPELQDRRDEERQARDEAYGERNRLLAELEAGEEEQQELYIALEIEKRGVEAAQLELDRAVLRLQADEAERKVVEGRAAHEAGAISRSQLDSLENSLATLRNDLRILDEKIVIASRPEPEEVLTEARLKMEHAAAQARKAVALREQALEQVDQQIRLIEARMEEKRHKVNRYLTKFPRVIEFSIAFLEQEAESLEDSAQDRARARQIEAELAELRKQLVRVRERPPNVVLSPIGGIARLMRGRHRVYQAGDDLDAGEVVMEVYPASNLVVRALVNETVVELLEEGARADIVVPALDERRFSGTVSHVARVGKDKFEDRDGRRREDRWAGVTVFRIQVRIGDVSGDLRPGMTAVLEIPVRSAEEVLYLPRAAVRPVADGFVCRVRTGDAWRERRVRGHLFSHRHVVVTAGVEEGDLVSIPRGGAP